MVCTCPYVALPQMKEPVLSVYCPPDWIHVDPAAVSLPFSIYNIQWQSMSNKTASTATMAMSDSETLPNPHTLPSIAVLQMETAWTPALSLLGYDIHWNFRKFHVHQSRSINTWCPKRLSHHFRKFEGHWFPDSVQPSPRLKTVKTEDSRKI